MRITKIKDLRDVQLGNFIFFADFRAIELFLIDIFKLIKAVKPDLFLTYNFVIFSRTSVLELFFKSLSFESLL